MAKKGIAAAELARQIGTTSRRLIDRCRAEGLFVQNSITKLSAEEERRVRAWFAAGEERPAERIDHALSMEGRGSVEGAGSDRAAGDVS